jgi:hypothetical protein
MKEIVNVRNDLKGKYVSSDLIHFIIECISIKYSFIVKNIIDAINDKNYVILNNQIK